jgi:hypothetical protein
VHEMCGNEDYTGVILNYLYKFILAPTIAQFEHTFGESNE